MVKTICLGLGYGMGKRTLAYRLGISEAFAAELIRSTGAPILLSRAGSRARSITRCSGTAFRPCSAGRCTSRAVTTRATAASPTRARCEISRVRATAANVAAGGLPRCRAGIKVVAPVHDAIAIETDDRPHGRRHRDDAGHGRSLARRARRIRARHQGRAVVYPARYADPRGAVMWDKVTSSCSRLSRGDFPLSDATDPIDGIDTERFRLKSEDLGVPHSDLGAARGEDCGTADQDPASSGCTARPSLSPGPDCPG